MKLRIFIAALLSSLAICFPYNIIGCAAGDPDPYDYFVSFFHRNVSGDRDHNAFYYTDYRFLYDAAEQPETAEVTASEWTGFAANRFSAKEAYQFMCVYPLKDINTLYYHIEKNQPLKIPDSVKKNGMTQFFLQQKDLEALGYILYAKKAEPYVVGGWNSWESPERDSVKMSGLIKNGQQLYAVAKNEFIKLRYAYQIVRLARYSGRLADCIKWYDELMKPNTTISVLQDLGLGLKAGAMRYSGKRHEAAYLFSQLFSRGKVKKLSNYKSFDFSVDQFDEKDQQQTMAFGKDKKEKSNVLALFAIGNNRNVLKKIQQLYDLYPASYALPVLITREINKLEEHYLTPSLLRQKGKQHYFIGYSDSETTGASYESWQQACKELAVFCKKAAGSETVHKGFYLLAAAYTHLLSGNYKESRGLLTQAKQAGLSGLQTDQWELTNLLLTINSKKEIDEQLEKELVPSVQWLEKKAKEDNEFAKFYRRLFGDVLAAKYKSAGGKNKIKYILCTGVADKIHSQYVKDSYGYYAQTLYDLRKEVPATEVVELIQLTESKKLNVFEQFLVSNASFSKDDLNDIAGTTWLRQYNFSEAEKWFRKVPAKYYKGEPFKTYLAANPFADLLLDTHRPTKQDTVKYSKLGFTQKMMKLEKELVSPVANEQRARAFYEMAKGYYHMSYWGNSWLLVEYDWSTAEFGYEDDSTTLSTKRNADYYLVNRSRDYYMKAMNSSSDKNLQAKCLYMAAKCEQKSFGHIPYYSGETDEYRKQIRSWLADFGKKTSYFNRLKNEFNTTSFYKEAFNTCSYLKDFVQMR